MNLLLQRMWFTDKSTIGALFIDKLFFCYSLEDAVREVKIANETAIPYGKYQVIISKSPKFGRLLPELLDVPGFTGVRIHSGNLPSETSGCILVGRERGVDCLSSSRVAFDEFFAKLETGLREGEVWLEIVLSNEGMINAS